MNRFNPKSNMASCLIVLSLAIAGVFFTFSAWSKTQKIENKCLTCHLDLNLKVESSSYKHAPFENGECGTCHMKQKAQRHRREPSILTNPGYLTEHAILLKGLISGASYDINLVLKDLPGNKVKNRVKGVIPARVRNKARNDEKPPVISGIRVIPIEKAPFPSATIMWDTDEPSTSCIKYGLSDQYSERGSDDIAMVKHHRVNISKLKDGKDYHFQIISRDMFGNQAFSEDCLFNTAKITGTDVTEKVEPTKLAVNNVELFMLRKRAKSSELCLFFETTRGASVTDVECKKVMDKCTDGKELNINPCIRCHPADVIGLTHTVGIAAKPTTMVPDYFPTLKGGIITCVTCHFAHGGGRQYFARSDTISCETCHGE